MLFDIFLRSGSRTQPLIVVSVHGSDAVLEVRAHDGVEQPRADDLGALRAQVHRERAREEVGVVVPAASRSAGVSDDVAHVSITSGSADEAAGLARAGPR